MNLNMNIAERASENPELPAQIRSRADLYRVYAGMPRQEMCLCFLDDAMLRKQIRILMHCSQPLHHEYAEHLRLQKGGSLEKLKWHAERATGAFSDRTVRHLLGKLSEPGVPCTLGMVPGGPLPLDVSDVPEEDLQLTETLFSFGIHLAANRAWSQTFFTSLLPYSVTLVFVPDEQQQADARKVLSAAAKAMCLVEDLAKASPNVKSPVHELLKDPGFT